MKILISNDDGIDAAGIRALVRAFGAAGYDVVVGAPDSQRSAASHSMTFARPLAVSERQLDGASRAFAIGGTPVDCVKLALHALCPDAEAVVSGINHGYNAGSDVLYSGTVGAAMEGALNGRPALAVSLAHGDDHFDAAASLAVRIFQRMMENPLPPLTVLNLNHPASARAAGVKAAPIKPTHYTESYAPCVLEDGRPGYHLVPGDGPDKTPPGDDDWSWLEAGYATLTALTFDMTDREATRALKGLF
ncbi:MAG: 5'/3'-nucleotidase SurE [Clostridia bacterium]|nr:5'/3'-nucleotidase SurE [Clostridia bacterium]